MPGTKTLSSWRDLEEYGVEVLTGESCAYGLRLLCDLDQHGVELLKEFFGGSIGFIIGSNWNTTGSTKGVHVASVMLPRQVWLPLAVYVLLRDGCGVVITRGHRVIGYTQEIWDAEFRLIYEKSNNRDYHMHTQPTNRARSGRHVHAISGRAK